MSRVVRSVPRRPGGPMTEPLLDRIPVEIRDRLRRARRRYASMSARRRRCGRWMARSRASCAGVAARAARTCRRLVNAHAHRRLSEARAAWRNREAVLRVLGERPGVSVNELSVVAGIGKAVLHSVLKKLEGRPYGSTCWLAPPATGSRAMPSPERTGRRRRAPRAEVLTAAASQFRRGRES
jgi:hypothetical protein